MWALELMGLDITFVPQTAIKPQAEWTETQQPPTPSPSRALEHVF
jgi:hypothetical protein